jgi:hypothetical protein
MSYCIEVFDRESFSGGVIGGVMGNGKPDAGYCGIGWNIVGMGVSNWRRVGKSVPSLGRHESIAKGFIPSGMILS